MARKKKIPVEDLWKAKVDSLKGYKVHQIEIYPHEYKKNIFEVHSMYEPKLGGCVYVGEDENMFMYTVGGMDSLDLDKVYFFAEDDILIISSFSEDKLKLKIKELFGYFDKLI